MYPTAEKYLRMMIELCREKGIEVMLFNAPAVEEHESLPRCNAVNDIAQEYSINYIDLNMRYREINFDPCHRLQRPMAL